MLPLAGINVVSIAFNLPGPAAVWKLREFGADVVKVEPPQGDPLAAHCADLYQKLVAGQHVVRLDLKQAADRAELDSHLAKADVLVTSTLPKSLARLGLQWNELHARFPRLCQVAILGYPAPQEELTGHDLTYQASVGLVVPPALPMTLLADMAGAQSAVTHTLAVLRERERTGTGVKSDVAIAQALEFYTIPLEHGMTGPGAHLGGKLPQYNLYPTRDGWLAVAALEPQFWARLGELLELKRGTREELAAVLLTRTALEWEAWAEQNRLPLAAVRTVRRAGG